MSGFEVKVNYFIKACLVVLISMTYSDILFAASGTSRRLSALSQIKKCVGTLNPDFALNEYHHAMAVEPSRGKSVFAYGPVEPFRLIEVANRFWRNHLNLESYNNKFVLHHSALGLVTDAIISFTEFGEKVLVLGEPPTSELGIGRSYLNREITHDISKDHFPLIIVSGSMAVNPSVVDKLTQEFQDSVILVIKRFEKKESNSILSTNPRIIEAIHFNQDVTSLRTQFVISNGSANAVSSIINTSESRGAWVGGYEQTLIRNWLEEVNSNKANVSDSPAIVKYEVSDINMFAKADKDGGLVSNLLALFPGYSNREYETSFAVGIGQPHTEINLSELKHLLAQTNSMSFDEGRRLAERGIRQFYLENFSVGLAKKNISFAEGVSGGIFQIFGLLPSGSKIVIAPQMYGVYKRVATIFNHELIEAPLTDKNIKTLAEKLNADAIILNFPHNPTGEILSPEARAKLQIIAKNGTLVVNDLSYPKFSYNNNAIGSLLSNSESKTNLLEIFSVSKDLGLPEERVSALVGDARLLNKIRFSNNFDESNISGARLGLVGLAINSHELYFTDRTEMQARKDAVINAFTGIGWPRELILNPKAGPNVSLLLPFGVSSEDVAVALWARSKVMVMPSKLFSTESDSNQDFLRVSLSLDSKRLNEMAYFLKKSGVTFENLVTPLTRSEPHSRILKMAGDEFVLKVFHPNSSRVSSWPLDLQRGYHIVQIQYLNHYGADSLRFIDWSNSILNPKSTWYIPISKINEDPVSFFGMTKETIDRLPVARNFSLAPSVDPSTDSWEIIRVANLSHPNFRKQLRRYISVFLRDHYSQNANGPRKVVVYASTINEKVRDIYKDVGFDLLQVKKSDKYDTYLLKLEIDPRGGGE